MPLDAASPSGPHGLDLASYDKFVVAFSGGKDSLALVLHLLELGVDRSKVELHHHDIDGHGPTFMDWECTPAYCRAVADALQLPIYFSWKEGGFEREMLRDQQRTAPTAFEASPGGEIVRVGGDRGKASTRLQYPQVSADLSVRWCSAYLKIDVLATLLRNSPRFEGLRTLVLTGERAQESSARARYAFLEPHRSDLRDGQRVARHVDQCRLIHRWDEADVWAIVRRWGVVPHPAYQLGWGRLSCRTCIFGSPNQWATVRAIYPEAFARVAAYEAQFAKTIQRSRSVVQLADRGTPYAAALRQPELAQRARSTSWAGPVLVDPAAWTLPAGAFGESTGPS